MNVYSNDQVEVLVNGKPAKKYSHNGKTYIEAKKGQEYSIRLKNSGCNRRMFTVSVDGINVVNGEAAGKAPFGYVLNGYSSYEIGGFRTNNKEVHPFKFNDKDRSYAAKSEETGGDVSNCGVIGAMIHDEKEKINASPVFSEVSMTYGPSNYSGLTREGSAEDLTNSVRCCNFFAKTPTPCQDMSFEAGTEFSPSAVRDEVCNTSFEVGRLVKLVEVFYDYRNGLIKMGVPGFEEARMPDPFPGGFCKPPKR